MNKAYLVTRGDYDEYEVLSVWLDRDKADEACALLKPAYYDCTVSEIPLNSMPSDTKPAIYASYTIPDEDFTFNPNEIVYQSSFAENYLLNRSRFYRHNTHATGNVIDVFAETKEKCADLIQNTMIEELYLIEGAKRLQAEKNAKQAALEAPMTASEFAAQRAEWKASQNFH